MRTLTMRGYLALILLLGAVIAGVGFAGSAFAQDRVVHLATGTFDVEMAVGDEEAVEAGLGLSRYTLSKTFSGGLTGTGVGQMLAGGPAGSQDTGTYVAIERVVGSLDGRAGGFIMAHRGDMTPDGYTLSITVVPNTGTGALEGIEGEFVLTVTPDGMHHYDLAYSLP
jgi:hypothetical protein